MKPTLNAQPLPAPHLFDHPEMDEMDEVFDRFHDECGVVGIYGHPESANLAYLALYALQHRGQESAGIASSNGQTLLVHRGMGLVALMCGSACTIAGSASREWKKPGAIALTRMPLRPHDAASSRVSPISPALEAAYGA